MTKRPPMSQSALESYLAIYGRPIGGGVARSRPNAAIRHRIEAKQGNTCLYCDLPIGATVTRRGKRVTLRRAWDHFIPFAYSARNPHDNWVIACHICNSIKSAKMFNTVLEAQLFIRPRWEELGYERTIITALPATQPSPPPAVSSVADGTDPDRAMLVSAERISNLLKKSRRVLPRGRIRLPKVDQSGVDLALSYLMKNGHVTEQIIDGKRLITLRREFVVRRWLKRGAP